MMGTSNYVYVQFYDLSYRPVKLRRFTTDISRLEGSKPTGSGQLNDTRQSACIFCIFHFQISLEAYKQLEAVAELHCLKDYANDLRNRLRGRDKVHFSDSIFVKYSNF